MKTALLDVKTALYNCLINDINLMNTITDVCDNVTPDNIMPYVVLGENTVIDWGTKTFDGEEITSTLHVWSDKKAKTEVMKIMNLVLQALTKQSLSLGNGFFIESMKRDYMEVFDDPSEAKHGVIRLRIKVSQ